MERIRKEKSEPIWGHILQSASANYSLLQAIIEAVEAILLKRVSVPMPFMKHAGFIPYQ